MYRRQTGLSLIEAVFVVFIGGILSAAILGTAALQNAVNFRAFNKMNSLMITRRINPLFQTEVHMTRFFGDQFGINASKFPGSNNPYASTYSFPTSTENTDWPTSPYTLDAQTLILQIPIFDSSNQLPKTVTVSGQLQMNVDTYVYKVLADKTKPGKGQFVLQRAFFPGDHSTDPGFIPPISPGNAQTIANGIVGPIDPTKATDPISGTPPPLVFGYLENWPGENTSEVSFPISTPEKIKGVSVTLESFNNEASSRADYTPQTLAMKSEFFKRYNGRQ